MRVAVLGTGAWGTALAIHLARVGHQVAWWDHNAARATAMRRDRRNPSHLRDFELAPNIAPTPDLAAAVGEADIVVPVVPSHALREVLTRAAPDVGPAAALAIATKGLEDGSHMTVAEVAASVCPSAVDRIAVLSGPSFALEVARGLPTAVVAAGLAPTTQRVAAAFHGDRFRVYTSEDVVGVCLGGSLKNVMAIAAGVADGLGLGHNAIAGIITRGLAETGRLATARGGQSALTLMGLAGLGDLVLTCTGHLSRNRRVGVALGQGRPLSAILEELGEVAEGVGTARNAVALAETSGVELPITEQVHAMLDRGRPPMIALAALLGRERRAERDVPTEG